MPRRFAALLVIAALAQMSLDGVVVDCSRGHAIAKSAVDAHDSMVGMAIETTEPGSASTKACDDCALPVEQPTPPCDHENATGPCSSMASCATTATVVVDAASALSLAHAAGVLPATSQAPEHTAPSPEPPPPRV